MYEHMSYGNNESMKVLLKASCIHLIFYIDLYNLLNL